MHANIRTCIAQVNTLSHYSLMNNPYMEFKEWLQAEMDKRQMTPSELARLSKVPQPTIFRILSGETQDPRTNTAKKLERALGVESPPLEPPVTAVRTTGRKVWVIGNGQGGFPDRIWGDGDYPVGASDEYAQVATDDSHAFVVRVWGESMVPRYMPGEYALVEPGTAPEIEDDVLVRLKTGETMIKRLLSRRAGIRLGSYGTAEVLTYTPEEVTWMYYVSHPIPARKIKHWAAAPEYAGEERRREDLPHDTERRGIERGHVKYFGYPVPDRMKGKKHG